MVSPGELRLISKLAEKDEFKPEIAENGAISYPEVERQLDETDRDPVEVLEYFTIRGVLTNEFVSKVYICPECTTEGMQYITICPSCESAHIAETTVFEHICGFVGPEKKFEAGDGYRCPDCKIAFQSEDIDEAEHYVCNECAEISNTLADRLWCRECLRMFPPTETIEQVVYRYSLAPNGKRWLDRYKTARWTVAEVLQDRRFETKIDTTVTNESESRSVHILAEDSLLGERRIVSIHETPDAESVESFCAFANSIRAHPIVVTISGTVEEDVAAKAESSDLKLLTFKGDGTLETEYEAVESATRPSQGLFQRLTAAINVLGRKGQ